MKNKNSQKLISFIFIPIMAFVGFNTNPEKKIETLEHEAQNSVKIETTEIKRFWKIFDKTKEERDKLYKAMVLDRENAPAIHKSYKMTFRGYPEAYSIYIDKYKDFYKSIRENTENLDLKNFDSLSYYFKEFQEIYPEASSVRVDLTLGIFSVGGSATKNSLVIGLEKFMKDFIDSTQTDPFVYDGQMSITKIVPLLMHEQMHVEQEKNNFLKGNSLLERALHERSADFVSNLITNANAKEKKYIYGNAHEEELWNLFKKEMNKKELSNWLFNGHTIKDKPGDLGYFMGNQICKSYYDNATDKKQAIRDILSIQSAKKFLKKSKYVEKFKK